MPKVISLPVRVRVPDFPQQLCPTTHRQVRLLLEAADEASLAGETALVDSLVARAREMVTDLKRSYGVAA